MKYLKLLLLFLGLSNISCLMLSKDKAHISHESSIAHELQLEKKHHTYKIFALSTAILATALFNTDNLIQSITDYPLSALALSCFIFNYLADTFVKYKEINHIFHIFALSKAMNRYMIYAIAIKNTMLEITKRNGATFFKTDEEYFQTVTSQIPLSFTELQTLISELSQSCNNSLHSLHLAINSDLEDHIYTLCKEHITAQDMLHICQQDKEFYPYLEKFYQHPAEQYQTTITMLGSLIKKHLQYMLKNQYYFSQ